MRYRNLEVKVVTDDEDASRFEEYGTMHLNSRHFISTLIEAKTGVPFKISITPEIPFLDPDSNEPKLLNMPPSRIFSPEGDSQGYKPHPNAPINMRVDIYLDGADAPARSALFYVDPDDVHFSTPNGQIDINFGWYKSANGGLLQGGWRFKELGIETILRDLDDIHMGTQATSSEDDQDELVKAMGKNLGLEGDEGDHQQKAGKITIVFTKCRIAKLGHVDLSVLAAAAPVVAANPSAAPNSTHAIDVDRALEPVEDTPIFDISESDEPLPFATFVFRYRSKDAIKKIVPEAFGPPPKPRPRKVELYHLTPLSMSSTKMDLDTEYLAQLPSAAPSSSGFKVSGMMSALEDKAESSDDEAGEEEAKQRKRMQLSKRKRNNPFEQDATDATDVSVSVASTAEDAEQRKEAKRARVERPRIERPRVERSDSASTASTVIIVSTADAEADHGVASTPEQSSSGQFEGERSQQQSDVNPGSSLDRSASTADEVLEAEILAALEAGDEEQDGSSDKIPARDPE